MCRRSLGPRETHGKLGVNVYMAIKEQSHRNPVQLMEGAGWAA